MLIDDSVDVEDEKSAKRVLKDINLSFVGGDKVAICGRTGR